MNHPKHPSAPTHSPSDWKTEVTDVLTDFIQVARLAGYDISLEDFDVEFAECPHRQPTLLPAGKMALYAFCHGTEWLKVGIAGSKSQARYTSQHYNPASAPSTLAASLAGDLSMAHVDGFSADNPGDWIRSKCHRLNVLIKAEHGRPLLALLESFFHCRLKPMYER